MSRMNGQASEQTPTEMLWRRLEVWINNPPEYEVMIETYKAYGRLKAAITRKKREIERVEETITVDIDKPRSTEAKKAKLHATTGLKDDLSELEAQLAELEAEVKALEYLKTMFNAANYRTRLAEHYA